MATTLLRIDASARREGSVTRDITSQVIEKIGADRVITRDLLDGVPLLSEAWVQANFTPADARTVEQQAVLAASDALVEEILAADTLVIGVPIYNFGVPAALKAWVDMVARAGLTFSYSEAGPKGLLEGKRAVLVVASGGTKVGSEVDFAVGYMRHVLGFIGITEIDTVAADLMAVDAEASLANARAALDTLAA